MTRLNILDLSASPPDIETWKPSPDNYWWRPKAARYVSTDLLLPGDILLFRPKLPNLFQKAIIRYQRRHHDDPSHTGFTHAAIYIGVDHLICEAVITTKVPPAGSVVIQNLEEKLADTALLARRLPGLSIRDRHEICQLATGSRGERYDVAKVLMHFFLGQQASRIGEQARTGVVCSTLCSRVLTKAAARSLPAEKIAFHSHSGLVTPADLSHTPNLADVALAARRVEG